MDCTPAATLSALLSQGVRIPWRFTDGSLASMEAARMLALGNAALAADHSHGMYPSEMAAAVTRLGARATVTRTVADVCRNVRAGAAAVVSGDARMLRAGPPPGDGEPFTPHTVAVQKYDEGRQSYVISNPALAHPTTISERDLVRFMSSPNPWVERAVGDTTYAALLVQVLNRG